MEGMVDSIKEIFRSAINDNETYQALEKWASDEFRSVNGQIESMLSQKLKETGRVKDTPSKTTKSNNKDK
jgi:hypothetical protein